VLLDEPDRVDRQLAFAHSAQHQFVLADRQIHGIDANPVARLATRTDARRRTPRQHAVDLADRASHLGPTQFQEEAAGCIDGQLERDLRTGLVRFAQR
jgi:hypothetical protein